MKKSFTHLCLLAAGMFAFAANINAQQEIYHGNSDWSEKPDRYGLIVDENFQDWYYDGAMRSASADCNVGRADRDNYKTFEMKRAVHNEQGMPNAKLSFFLDYCQIQPTCDTQSGQNFTNNPGGTGGDFKGPSWTNVSLGCISIYDNYEGDRPNDMGLDGYGSGSFTTSKIAELERIQYAVSSYGGKRGFHLELGREQSDGSVIWDTIRYVTGNINTTLPLSVKEELTNKDMTETNRGTTWQEVFTPRRTKDVYIRFRPVTQNKQIVRLHDLKIYGVAVDSDGGPNPNNPTSIGSVTADSFKIYGNRDKYIVTKEANVKVYNLSGHIVRSLDNTSDIDLSGLTQGVYIIKAVSADGTITKQVIR